jgi:ppGpp synthetase/RelA/SpoT-type nucleotidyltranferase
MSLSHLLVLDDVLDLAGFVRALCDPEDAVSNHLTATLEPGLFARLRESNEEGVVSAATAKDLLAELNGLIGARSIYDEKAFEYARLTTRTIELAAAGPSGSELVLLNRRLLTEAYPAFVRLVYAHGTPECCEFQVDRYKALLPDHELYAAALRRVIHDACRVLAPYAVIEVRVKSVSSFAEKAWRKGYTNPICQTTDPVGGRVITETQAQVEDVCEYVKQAFLVDTANSVDHRDRLKADQFGYLSIQYVVMPKREQVEELEQQGIVPVGSWPALKGRKAEIQVRTMLQHAHATICHDRVYKSPFTVPESIQRDLARVAALLEQGDSALGQAVDRVGAYSGSYGAHRDAEKRTQEVQTLETVLRYEPDPARKPGIALNLALIKKAIWDWQGVAETLRDYLDQACPEQARVWMEYGHARCRMNQKDPYSAEYEEGVRELEKAAEALAGAPTRGPKQLLIQALSSLAWAYGNRDEHVEDIRRARDAYRRAYALDRSNPYNLASYLEFEISMGVERDVLRYMRETLLEAAGRCREHARAGVELPWAHLTMGRLYLLAEKPYESLAAYCKAIHLCAESGSGFCYPRQILDDEQRFLRNIGKQESKEEDGWVLDLLELALYVRYGAADAWRRMAERTIRPADFLPPVIIVSGGTHPDVQADMRSYEDCLSVGFQDFAGTLVSGGTTAGIPGLVGELVAKLKGADRKVYARCYLPVNLPWDAPRDARYDQVVSGVGREFGPLQSLQSWIDLVIAGVDPTKVKLLGINGGPLTGFEYKLALALGATVGVIRESGRAAEELAPDEDWQEAGNLLWLPCDPMTVRAFADKGVAEEAPPQVLLMARKIHQDYLDDNWPRSKDRIMRPWEHLDRDIKASNIGQAAYAAEILRRAGYEVRQVKGKIEPYQFGPDEDELVEQMAEMEHGRWNVERLRSGWKYGKQKDEDKRISPFLRPWRELPEKTKEWDRQFVRQWPQLLAECEMEVSRPPGS